MPGHVFVVRGDLRALACDAWLLPTDARLRLTSGWLTSWPRDFDMPATPVPPADFRPGDLMPWPDWPSDRARPWLAAVGAGRRDPSWPARCAERWLAELAEQLPPTPRHGRSKRLVGLPVLATGSGGQYDSAGEVLRELLPALRRQAIALDLDVALVARDAEIYAAARAVRGTDPSWWSELDEPLATTARALAAHAGDGNLVLFLGAGVSVGAGLPDWSKLLQEIATRAGIDIGAKGWAKAGLVDQASILQRRLGKALATEVVAQVKRPEASLQHHLLASLPITEAITTNYDDLFELASGAPTVSVLPHAPRPGAQRWLLKMHGCVTRPVDIVLTREDYLRYEQRRIALAGIVQAMLMTRHMLFVGFSLNDDNFHKVADAVRRARDPEHKRSQQFGTVLRLDSDPFSEELWKDELDFVAMGGGDGAARRLEIFLDAVLAHAPFAPLHFLNERFAGTLSAGERVFRDALVDLLAHLPEEARRGPAWQRLSALVSELGGGGDGGS